MRSSLFLLASLIGLAFSGSPAPKNRADIDFSFCEQAAGGGDCQERPTVNIPPPLRCSNWGGGSCVHASTVMLLRWQGQHKMADWWRATYSGGEYAERLNQRLTAAKLRYAYTTSGDAVFLEWALRTRRGAGITFWPGHAVNLVHLDEKWAGLLDNNRLQSVIWIPRDEFLSRWQGYGGWAWTLVYRPPPPLPCVPSSLAPCWSPGFSRPSEINVIR